MFGRNQHQRSADAQFQIESAISRGVTRRRAIGTSLGVGAGVWLGTSPSARGAISANGKLNIACIGVGGRGQANLKGVKGENLVALCDVDDDRAGNAFDRFPKAKRFYDYRRMLDAMHNELDAVVISTPDHTHFHPTYAAMQLGKHVYLEKPMAHSVQECRILTDLAKEKRLATQLGVQRHTLENMHRVVELVQAGTIGNVDEVYCWVGGERGMPDYPPATSPQPAHLKWDLWLGPAQERPFSKAYAPYGWRFWWDFGTGETGNWGCHILDIPFWALDLKYPKRVSASGPPPHPQTTPKQMQTQLIFPGNDGKGEIALHWDHSKDGPARVRELGVSLGGMNTCFFGDKGILLCGFDKRRLLPDELATDAEVPAKSIPDSPGFHTEWINACKGGERATCDFVEYAGPLAESVLLANAAYRAQGEFKWGAKNLKSSGNPDAEQFLRSEYRKGWEI